MANDLFRRQLAGYASVHRDWRNKATHFVGIPLIVFSLLLILSLARFEAGGRDWTVSLAVAIVAVLAWMALDLGIGILMGLVIAPAWYAAVILASALGSPSAVWVAFTVLFVGGWALQFLGHHYEGKRPALLDNIFQGFIGPMFLVAEILVVMGRRRDLADAMGGGHVTVR
ncbi:MAG: Mpo1 family 2-hydroxy fatty acid dioxygenase [Reyranella sp.]